MPHLQCRYIIVTYSLNAIYYTICTLFSFLFMPYLLQDLYNMFVHTLVPFCLLVVFLFLVLTLQVL